MVLGQHHFLTSLLVMPTSTFLGVSPYKYLTAQAPEGCMKISSSQISHEVFRYCQAEPDQALHCQPVPRQAALNQAGMLQCAQ